MKNIEFTTEVKFGDTQITKIDVAPLTFIDFAKLWKKVSVSSKPEAALQRARIEHQVHFSDGKKRIAPNQENIGSLHLSVVRQILDSLDEGQGEMGKVISNAGDGVTTPILYQLGTPIKLKSGKDNRAITELEFQATTYSEVEDVLAATSDVEKTETLLRTVATPVGVEGLLRLPEWAMEQITMADGVGVMQGVSPAF